MKRPLLRNQNLGNLIDAKKRVADMWLLMIAADNMFQVDCVTTMGCAANDVRKQEAPNPTLLLIHRLGHLCCG